MLSVTKLEEQSLFSPTGVCMWLRCPRQFFFRYVRGMKIPPKGIMVLGTSVHAGIEEDYKNYLEHQKLLPMDDVCDIMLNAFAVEKESVDWSKDEEDASALKEDGIKVLRCFKKERAEHIIPVEVEAEFDKNVVCGPHGTQVRLAGRIDLIDNKDEVVDFKVVGRAPSAATFDLQIGMYAFVKEKAAGRKENLVRSKLPKVVTQEFRFGVVERRWIERAIASIRHAYDEGIFPPNPEGWHCSEAYCGYWQACREGEDDVIIDFGTYQGV